MRRTLLTMPVLMAALLPLLVATVATAQDEEPAQTPPPAQFPRVQTALIMSALADPAVNEIILTAGRDAHLAIGGRPRELFTGTLPRPENVAIASRDLAELEYDIVVITGGDSQVSVGAAGNFPNSEFFDIGQPLPCVTADGIPDPSGTCAGDISSLPLNYSVTTFAVDQAAYLAGVIAAAASREARIGIIAGQPGCEECERYIEGFILGARSVKPNVEIELGYLADDDIETAFGDAATARIFTEAFINVYQPDVLFAVAGGSSRGMIEAACEAGILAVGSDFDVSASYPTLGRCILTSVTKDLSGAVGEAIFAVPNEVSRPEVIKDLAGGGVSLTDEWRDLPSLPVDTFTRFDEARQSILTGFLDTCPVTCGTGGSTEPGASPDPETDPDQDASPEPAP